MKQTFILIAILLTLTACRPSQEELAFKMQEAATATAANWTKTPTRTPSATFTSTPTLTPTSAFTPTPTPTPFAGGGSLAFWQRRNSNSLLYSINQDGTDLRMLFDTVANGFLVYTSGLLDFPNWSPNGRYFFFNKIKDQTIFYYLFDSNIHEVNLLAELPFLPDCTWEPDGDALICSITKPYREPWQHSTLGIFRIPIIDSPELIFTFDEYCQAGIIWSMTEDGDFLLYMSGWDSEDKMTKLVLVDEDCEVTETLYSEPFNEKVSLQKQKYLSQWDDFFLFAYVNSTENNNQTIFYKYSFREHSLVKIFEFDLYTLSYQISPDGTMISMINANVFEKKVSDWPRNIQYISGRIFRVMDIESQEILFTDENILSRSEMCWSRDSQYLFYDTYRLELISGEKVDIFSSAGVTLSETNSGFACSP